MQAFLSIKNYQPSPSNSNSHTNPPHLTFYLQAEHFRLESCLGYSNLQILKEKVLSLQIRIIVQLGLRPKADTKVTFNSK